MKRAIITGGTGFIGANLARRLLRDGHEIHLLVRPGYTAWRIESMLNDIHLHEVELGNVDALSLVIRKIRPDWVFHLATYGAYASQADPRRMVHTNISMTINLVEACLKKGFEAFINTGSSSEYGFKDHSPAETEWLEPNSHYAITKASATLFCRYTAQSRRANITTLRLYSVYGPYEEPPRLMPTLIMRGLNNDLPPLVSPDIARDYVYVDDINEAYLLAVTQRSKEFGAVFNVGTGIQTSLRELVDLVRCIMGITVEPRWSSMPNRQWDTNVWVANRRKIQDDLGWLPKYSLEHGFRQMLDWFSNNRQLQNFYKQAIAK